MATQQAIMKAVEVDNTVGISIQANYGGDANFIVYPTQSLYPNIMALAADLSDQLETATAAYGGGLLKIILVQLTSKEFKFALYNQTLTHYYNVLTDYDLLGFTSSDTNIGQDKVGFDDGLTHVYVRVATNIFKETFLPTYYSSDSNLWEPESEKGFIGVTGVDGNLSGTSFTKRYIRDISWNFEHAYNTTVNASGATSTQSDNSFDSIINGARENSLSISTDNTYCKGLYFIDDLSSFASTYSGGLQNELPLSYNSGSYNGNYVFCSSSVPNIQDASFQNSKLYYNIGCTLTTAVSPAWTWDIS